MEQSEKIIKNSISDISYFICNLRNGYLDFLQRSYCQQFYCDQR